MYINGKWKNTLQQYIQRSNYFKKTWMHEIFSKDTTVFPRVLLSCMLSSTDTFKKGETGLSPRKYITEQKLHCIIHNKWQPLWGDKKPEMTINTVGILPKVKKREYYRHQWSHLFDEKFLQYTRNINRKQTCRQS